MRRARRRHARHGELGDLENRARNSHELAGVLVVLALAVNQLEFKHARVPVDRGLDVADGEREVQDVGDHQPTLGDQ